MRAMNLLPPEERGGTRGVSGAPGRSSNLTAVHGIAGVGAVVTVGLIGFWAVTKHDTASAREAEANAVAQSAAAQQQVTRLAPVVAFDARRQARETSVLTLASGRTDWAQVLRATAGSLPSNVSVTTLKLAGADATGAAAAASTGAAGSTGLAATNGTVTLQVCADTQPRVATTLRRFRALPQVDDVALSQTARAAKAAGGSGGGATGGANCDRVAADAALSLSQQTIIDGVPTPAPAAAAAPGTATTPDGATTTSSTTTTNGTGR